MTKYQREDEIGYRNDAADAAHRAWMLERWQAGQQQKRIAGFANTFEKANRIIANRNDTKVVFMDDGPAPGWTDGVTVSINARMLEDALGNDIRAWVRQSKAINLHELSHVLYTPRKGHGLFKWAADHPYLFKHWNILEDQRIEMMFVAKYRPAGAYFESMILQWFLNTRRQFDTAHVLLHGRRYLPTELTQPVRTRFVEQNGKVLTADIEAVIDEYKTLLFPRDTDRAKELIQRFADLCNQIQGNIRDIPFAEDVVAMNKGKPQSKKNQEEAQKQMGNVQPRELAEEDAEEAEDATGEGAAGAGDEESEESGDAEGQGQGQEGQEGAEEGSGAQGGQDGPTGAENASQGVSGVPDDIAEDGAGKGHAEQGPAANGKCLDDEDLRKILEDVKDDLDNDIDFNDDIDRAAKNIADAIDAADMDVDGKASGGMERPVRPELAQASKSMQRELAEMRVLLEPEHIRKQVVGKLDARKFLTRQPWDVDFFTAYDAGALDETEIEAVILMDMSGSMAGRMTQASEAMWAATTALESLNGRVTCIGFGDRHHVLAGPNEKADKSRLKVYGTMGGTDPTGALGQAYNILTASSRSIKLLLTVTDGQWFCDLDKTDMVIKSMNNNGVTSALMFVGNEHHAAAKSSHSHTFRQVVNDLKALPETAVSIVEHAMADRITMT